MDKIKEIQVFFERLAIDSAHKFIQDQNIVTELKGDGTPVTIVDKRINGYVVCKLKEVYPDIPILSEELDDDGRRLYADYCFIIDPIDGTAALKESKGVTDLYSFIKFIEVSKFDLKNLDTEKIIKAGFSPEGITAFLRFGKEEFEKRIKEYSILLGLAHQGKSVCGVCYLPAEKIMYSASVGKGAEKIAFKKRTKIRASNNDSGRTLVGRYNIDDDLEEILRKGGKTLKDVSYGGSFGIKVCWTAEGRFDKFIHTNLDPDQIHASLWDSCAVDIILAEAGGKSFDLDKNPIDYLSKQTALLNGYIATGNF